MAQHETPSLTFRLPALLASMLLVVGVLYVGRVFFITLIVAILLAFILEPVVGLFMRIRVPRVPASFLACTLMLGTLYLLMLGLASQMVGLWHELPTYSERVTELVDSASLQIDAFEKTAEELLLPKRLRQAPPEPEPVPKTTGKRKKAPAAPELPPPVQEVRIREDKQMVNFLWDRVSDYWDVLLMASFVPFLVYFMLSWRDHFRRSFLSLMGNEMRRSNLQGAWDGIGHVARAYLVGNFLLGVVLAFGSSLFFWYVDLPYWQVAGPLSGFLSLVPYLGLPLAMIPPFIAALPVHTTLGPYLALGVAVSLFHLVGLNLLYPKLVGARVHLNPLVVTVAMMLWYLLWGGAGLILAIPITAGMKAAFDNIPSLRAVGRVLGD